jgi:hypothetical protein
MQHWRTEITAGLVGTVVVIGFGSGLNVEHSPPGVGLILAVEPRCQLPDGADRTPLRQGTKAVELVHPACRGQPGRLEELAPAVLNLIVESGARNRWGPLERIPMVPHIIYHRH